MRGTLHRVAVVGLLTGMSALSQTDVAEAQSLRSRMPRPVPPRRDPVPLVLDRLEITIDPAATGDARKLQQEIAAQFARQPLYPKERMKEFAWIKPPPEDRRMGTWICGWHGMIEKMSRTADGWRVTVMVIPRLADAGALIRERENQYIENYEYSAGTLRFLEANAPPTGGRPRVITWN